MPCTGIPFDVVSIFISQDRAYYNCPILTVVSIYRDRGRTVLYKVIFGISRTSYFTYKGTKKRGQYKINQHFSFFIFVIILYL